MTTTSNLIQKQKQAGHAAASTSNAVSDAVDVLNDFYLTVQLPTGSDGNTTVTAANDSVAVSVPLDCKLQNAYLTATAAITNTAGDTILVNVATNGVAAITFDSDDLAATAAANSATALTVNTVNSFVDIGEVVLVSYTMEDNTNNYLEGILTLGFRRV